MSFSLPELVNNERLSWFYLNLKKQHSTSLIEFYEFQMKSFNKIQHPYLFIETEFTENEYLKLISLYKEFLNRNIDFLKQINFANREMKEEFIIYLQQIIFDLYIFLNNDDISNKSLELALLEIKKDIKTLINNPKINMANLRNAFDIIDNVTGMKLNNVFEKIPSYYQFVTHSEVCNLFNELKEHIEFTNCHLIQEVELMFKTNSELNKKLIKIITIGVKLFKGKEHPKVFKMIIMKEIFITTR